MLKIDLLHALKNDEIDNFHVQLFKLMLKANKINFTKLKEVYPKEAQMLEYYKSTGDVPSEVGICRCYSCDSYDSSHNNNCKLYFNIMECSDAK